MLLGQLLFTVLNLRQGAVRVKIDPSTKDMRDPDRVHMPSDASCIAKDGVTMVNHEVKITGNSSKLQGLNQRSATSGIVSHIVTLFCYGVAGSEQKQQWRYLGGVLSEIKHFMIDPRTDTPRLDSMRVHWGSIEALYSQNIEKTKEGKVRKHGNISARVKDGFLRSCSANKLQHATTFGDLLVRDFGTAVPTVCFK